MDQETAETLRLHGLNPTPVRLRMLQYLEAQALAYPEVVYRRWSLGEAPLSLATIYRTLADLTKVGLVDRYQYGPRRSLFTERRPETLTVLSCTACGDVVQLADFRLPGQPPAPLAQTAAVIAPPCLIHALCFDCIRAEDLANTPARAARPPRAIRRFAEQQAH